MSLVSLFREHAEMIDGRISWVPHVSLFPDKAGRRKRLEQTFAKGQRRPWPDLKDSDGKTYSFFRSRGCHCPHPEKWRGQYPRFTQRKRPYFTVLATECKSCEFHEPRKQFGKRRYAKCSWSREWHAKNTPTGLDLLASAFKTAREITESPAPRPPEVPGG